MNRKFAKFISDSNAQIQTAFGNHVEMVNDHPRIADRILVQSPGVSTYTFLLEDLYYGTNDSIDFIHPERYLYFLKDIWVTGSEGHLFLDPRTVFAVGPSLEGVSQKKIRRPLRFLAKHIDSPVFILAGRAPGNRAHFLIEHLPRLCAALEIIKKVDDVKILVTPEHRKWQIAYLEKFGISEDRILEGSETTTFCRQAMYIPLLSEGGREVICERRYYDKIRSLFKPSGKSGLKLGAPVFISRQDATTRRLSNEEEIFNLTRKFFPEIKRVTLSSMTIAEQIALFQQSPVIIGPHGQPFRNVMFSNNALVIQLIPGEKDVGNEYQRWGRNFNCIGDYGQNRCISLYSGESLVDGASHWTYNPDKLGEELHRILLLQREIG